MVQNPETPVVIRSFGVFDQIIWLLTGRRAFACFAALVPWRDAHTFATRCIELGFDVKSLSEILGHATVNITLNRYVHPAMELKQQNMQKLSGLLTVI